MPCNPTLIGMDGCKGGWIAAIEEPDRSCRLAFFPTFGEMLASNDPNALVVVDMPIGLPDRIVGRGRAAEQAVLSLLKKRRHSVFVTPPRPVVERFGIRFRGMSEILAAFREACELSKRHSSPASAFSIQGFSLLPRISEIDRILRSEPALAERVMEGHPEVAFAVFNEGVEMAHPKKTAEGRAERRELLLRLGVSSSVVTGPRPRGAAEDDRLDACAMLHVARRCAERKAVPYPDPPARDAHGLPIVIWA